MGVLNWNSWEESKSPGRGMAHYGRGKGCHRLASRSSLWVFLNSWGPDDDGKTVDGPHQLGKVTEPREDFRKPQTPSSFTSRRILQVSPSHPTPFSVPGLCHLALPPPFWKTTANWTGGWRGSQVLREGNGAVLCDGFPLILCLAPHF